MRAARKPTKNLSLQDLGLADGGASLVRQTVERLYIPKKEGHCQYIEGATAQEMAANLVRELQIAKLL
jgi:electron transfer flavoprotein alpha/beta subunit